MENLERYIAIDNKCAWPNLTLLSDGSIVATIFGEPCHQLWERVLRMLDQPRWGQALVLSVRSCPPRARNVPGRSGRRPDSRECVRGSLCRPQIRRAQRRSPGSTADARRAGGPGVDGLSLGGWMQDLVLHAECERALERLRCHSLWRCGQAPTTAPRSVLLLHGGRRQGQRLDLFQRGRWPQLGRCALDRGG